MAKEDTDLLVASFKGPLTDLVRLVKGYLEPNLERILASDADKDIFKKHPPAQGIVGWAVESKSYSLIQFFLSKGWDINSLEKANRFWLSYPSVLEDKSFATWLLDHGADPSLGKEPELNPRTPRTNDLHKGELLTHAGEFATVEVFDLLESRGANFEFAMPLHGAAVGGSQQIPLMEKLLERGVDINSFDVYTCPSLGTPLHYAARHGHFDAVKFLLDHDADPHLENMYGKTPLDKANSPRSPALPQLVEYLEVAMGLEVTGPRPTHVDRMWVEQDEAPPWVD